MSKGGYCMVYIRDNAVTKYLGRVAPTTAVNLESTVKTFFTWIDEEGGSFAGITPSEAVEWQREHLGSYEIVDLVETFLQGRDRLRARTKTLYLSRVRGLFAHNRVPLPDDPTFKVKSRHEPVLGTLTIEELKRVILKSNKVYRAIFLCMFQGGMGRGELVYWSMNGLDKLKNQLARGEGHIKATLPGRKRSKNKKHFYTWIGYDAVEAIRDYLKVRGSKPGPIFLNQYGTGVSEVSIYGYWWGKLHNLGLISKGENRTHRTGKNLHEVRDLFRTRWEKSPAKASVAEFMMGHVIDPNEYNKAMRDQDFTLSEYIQAEPWLNIMSQDPGVVPRVELDKHRIETNRTIQLLNDEVVALTDMVIQLSQRIQLNQGLESDQLKDSLTRV
jgi:integrase